MGEHVRDDVFRVVDISVQRTGGSQGHFVRDPASHEAQLRSFFDRTHGEFTRFNYLGEWHSHPTFEPVPSTVDRATMQSLVEDPIVGVNFLILLVVTLAADETINGSATAFRPKAAPLTAELLIEQPGPRFPGVRMLLRRLCNRSDSGRK